MFGVWTYPLALSPSMLTVHRRSYPIIVYIIDLYIHYVHILLFDYFGGVCGYMLSLLCGYMYSIQQYASFSLFKYIYKILLLTALCKKVRSSSLGCIYEISHEDLTYYNLSQNFHEGQMKSKVYLYCNRKICGGWIFSEVKKE